MGTWKRLAEWARGGDTVAVAVVGAGYVGSGVVHRLTHTPGLRPAVVVNRTLEHAIRALEQAGHARRDIVVSDDADALDRAIAARRPAVCPTAAVLGGLDEVDVVVEATGAMTYGATAVLDALASGKDVVSFNAELDATLGLLLHHVARAQGAVYTIADGDQPGVLLRLMESVEGMGFDTVAAVNCKRNLNLHQNPDDSRPYAERDGTSVLMATAFGDGTKMQVEQAVVANAAGLVPDRRGMHGVRTTLEGAAGDITAAVSRSGVVEFTLGGDFAAGVCVVGRPRDPEAYRPYMRFLKMGEGPHYLFFRPYHLVHLEVPVTIAEVVLDRQGLGRPTGPPGAEVVTVAKRDLRPGEQLDGIGGFTCYGLVDTTERAQGLLPIGLSEHALVTRPVSRDAPVALDAVELDDRAPIVQLRRRQDGLAAGVGVQGS